MYVMFSDPPEVSIISYGKKYYVGCEFVINGF